MFKVGDEVKIIRDNSDLEWCRKYIGTHTTIRSIEGDRYTLNIKNNYGHWSSNGHWSSSWNENELQLIKNNNINQNKMNIIEKFKLLGLGEPEKSFRILGIQNEKGELTEEGKSLYQTWRFEQDKKDFADAVVAPLLKELEKDK